MSTATPRKTSIKKCVFFFYLKFGLMNFFLSTGTRKVQQILEFHPRKSDKYCSKDLYFLGSKTVRNGIELRQDLHLSMRKLSNLSRSVAFWQSFPRCFFSVDLFFRRRRPMGITGAVAGNLRFQHIKTVLC